MRRENWFVIILVALCMALAAMAAVSSTPSSGDNPGFEGVESLDDAHRVLNEGEALINESIDVLESV
ncbi:MAG: hypothetical protein V2J42_04195 [Wenzhouxiangella sp.]|jgi:hypothetical protein|nr:hypothetical protein [Wenzhouxiangella sp.]